MEHRRRPHQDRRWWKQFSTLISAGNVSGDPSSPAHSYGIDYDQKVSKIF
ncbi:hypothetical protein LG634_08765 [Streptomyces bambusae]|nr:hypothetical protein [Streptomyces bambusae]MCB5164919.1 hypothetical protein [Streptomyces bambusae]